MADARVICLQSHRAVRSLTRSGLPFERGARRPVVVQAEGDGIALLLSRPRELLSLDQAGELAGDILRLLDARAQLSAVRAFRGLDPHPHEPGCCCDACEGCAP
jgi:hypothetical protein